MPNFRYNISGRHPFHDEVGSNLPSAVNAWNEALRFVRDIEGSLQPGETWTLDVLEEGTPIFQLMLSTKDLQRCR
jgi:hypothetical protein